MSAKTANLLVAAALLFLAPALFGQSLLDNPDYQKAVQLQRQAQAAYAAGDYDKAAELSEQARTYLERSDAYVAGQLLIYRANSRLKQAEQRVAYFRDVGVDPRFRDVLAQAREDLGKARTAFNTRRYEDAVALAQKVLDALAPVTPAQAK